ERRAEHGKLELGPEIFEQRGVDEPGVLRPRDPGEGLDQDVVDVPGEEEAADEGDAERDQGLDQPRAQLDQVIHQRRLGRLDLLLVLFPAHAGLPSASELPGAVLAGTGSVEEDGAFGSAPVLGASGGSDGAGVDDSAVCGAVAADGLATALSIWCCMLSNSLRTSP